MKKKLFLMACLAVWGVQMSNAQSGTIALHHEGKVTIYDSGNIQSAVDASVKGDTLYLSEGTFGGFTITKIRQYRRNAYCENCIVNSRYSFVGTLKNCLYKDDNGTRVDCYKDESWSFNDLDCSLTNEELATKGYYGTDGTIVGCYGGTSPFSLIPATPHIKEHSLEVDELGTTLKVTLKIGTE